jgi:hypothetical protein
MSKPFTKLEKRLEELFEPNLKLKMKCFSYPLRSQYGSSSIPRFYLQLDKDIIWEFPKDFEIKEIPFYSWMSDNKISELIREYIDTPVAELLDKEFATEKLSFMANYMHKENKQVNINYKLMELFKAADRRFGKEKLFKWHKEIDNPKVDLILLKRFESAFAVQLTFKERARIALEQLSKQPPVTLAELKEQIHRIHARRTTNTTNETK